MKETVFVKTVGLSMSIILTVLLFAGCSLSDKANIEYANDSINVFKIKSWGWIDQVNAEFGNKNPVTKVNSILFNDYTTYQTKLITELYAGKGPDVIISPSGEVRNMIKNKVLVDLNQIMPGEFDMVGIGGSVQDIGLVQDKRYFLSLDYKIPLFLSSKSLVEKAGLPQDTFSSWENFASLAKEYNSQGKYLIGGNKNSIDKFFLYMLAQSGTEFIDYNLKKSKVVDNSNKILKLMDLYKNDILPAICPDKELSQYKNLTEAMKAGLFILNFSDQENYRNLWMENSMISSSMDSEMTAIQLPNDGGDLKKYINRVAAINNNSKYKKKAVDYLIALLDAEKEDDTFSFPTSKELEKEQLDRFGANEKTGKTGIVVATEKETEVIKTLLLPKALSSKFEEISSKAVADIYDYGVQDIIIYRIGEFINNKKTAEETLKNIDSAINKLLKE